MLDRDSFLMYILKLRGYPVPVNPSPSREWCAYVRVSKVKGREGESFHSPAEQEERIRRSTSEPVLRVFPDLDVSGGTWVREGLDDALAWMREKPSQRGMIVMDIDRLGRDLHGSLAFLKAMDDAGMKVRVLADEIETADPDGMLKWQVLMLMADYQRQKIGARWKSIQSRRRAGLPSGGGARFGYRIEEAGDPPVKRQVPDPVTGPALRQCYLDYTNGAGYQAMVKRLNDAGIKTTRGGDWSTHSLRRALDSGFGAGQLRLTPGGFAEGIHDPVITKEEWEAFLRTRDRRAQLPSKVRTPRWYLSGIARCGLCGATLVVSSHQAPGASVICSAYTNKRTCTGVWVPKWALEHSVTNWVGAHLQEIAAQAWDSSTRDEAREGAEARLQRAKERLLRAQEALARLAHGYATGLLDETAVAAARPVLLAERDAADQEASEAHLAIDSLLPVGADEYDRLINATDGMTPSEWGHLLGRVLRSIKVDATTITYEPVIGPSQSVPRPGPRPRAAQARTEIGTFA